MAERILSGKIKQLVYTTEELSQSPLSTTVIDNGVLVYEKTSSGQIKCKMGDGNNVWSGLNYIEDSDKMNKNNPTGTGSLSMNRDESEGIGENSIALGIECVATANYSYAEGYKTRAYGSESHTEGHRSKSSGYCSHAEGYYTETSSNYQHVQGKYNIEDTSSTYAHIVGGGTSNTDRKNIHTLDWNGNAVFSGDVTATGYEVTNIEGAQYGFELNSNGYYESQNAGINSSYSICKINLISDGFSTLYLDCINSGENNFDYGILSKVDETLSLSYSADSSYFKSFKGLSSTSVKTVNYGVLSAGEHFIYVKYRKDSSASSGNDSLQFKVRLE